MPGAVGALPLALTISVLEQNTPTPFNPLTQITFSVAVSGKVRLQIHDIAGRLVRTLSGAWREPGVYSEVWNGKADDGRSLHSGVYFYSIKAGDFVVTGEIVVLRSEL